MTFLPTGRDTLVIKTGRQRWDKSDILSILFLFKADSADRMIEDSKRGREKRVEINGGFYSFLSLP